jgi:tRNA (guanine37-N1)-methyltransferase
MRFDIVTIFPEFFSGPLEHGIVRRAREANLIEVRVQDLREFTHDKHRTVDDRPFGGGEGMLLKPEPLFEAVESLAADSSAAESRAENTAIVLLSASGRLFDQQTARRFSKLQRVVLLCGRYEGVDERVAEHLATDEVSIGDFVLSGGELAAAMVMDAVVRLVPGALGNEDSTVNESFSVIDQTEGARPFVASSSRNSPYAVPCFLDYPHYTRPPSFRGWNVPEVLLSGNHEEIRKWRHQRALEKTLRNRPDLLEGFSAAAEETP